MSLPKLQTYRTARAERLKERARLRELANAVHYVFLPGGAPLNGTLDISDRIAVNAPGSPERPNAKLIPQGRLVPLRSFYYPCPVLANETTSRQIYESGIYEPDDEDLQSTVDAHQPAAAQAAELFESYGNPIYGIGLVIITSCTAIEGVDEFIEPLLWPERCKDIVHLLEMLEGAKERISDARVNKEISYELAEIAYKAAEECKEATLRQRYQAERECERAVNEVESARAGHEGAKQLDPCARYWFKQLRVIPPRDEIFARRVERVAGAVETPDPTLYKQCEFCAEDIKAQAKVCRWCNRSQSNFEVAPAIPSAAIAAMAKIESQPTPEPEVPFEEETEALGGFGLVDEEDRPKAKEEPELPKEISYGRKIPTPEVTTRFDKKKKD